MSKGGEQTSPSNRLLNAAPPIVMQEPNFRFLTKREFQIAQNELAKVLEITAEVKKLSAPQIEKQSELRRVNTQAERLGCLMAFLASIWPRIVRGSYVACG